MGVIKAIRKAVGTTYMKKAVKSKAGKALIGKASVARSIRANITSRAYKASNRNFTGKFVKEGLEKESKRLMKRDATVAGIGATVAGGAGVAAYKRKKKTTGV